MNFGKFIVFEGINGCGKTTLINNLIKYYNKQNIKHIYLKFPDRTSKSGKIIDDFLKNKYNFNSLEDQIKIFAENRKEAQNLIFNHLSNGYIILCDRYIYSNLAYTLTDQSLDIYNKKKDNYLDIDNILKYDNNIIKPNLIFLINGNYIDLRNEKIKERYHKDAIKNMLIFNNYLFALNYTNTKYNIINNEYNDIKSSLTKISYLIDNIQLIKKIEYFN